MIIGHQKQWQFLRKSAETGKISHAYLFCGQEKLGKKTLALKFINLLFQEDVTKKPHPDFIFLEPQNEEIEISQIRELIAKLSLKPVLAPFKVAVIDRVHCLNWQAQNCFLKTLEEPKGKTVLILVSEHPEMLLPTIVSRCEIIRFYPVSKTEMEKYLQNQKISHERIPELSQVFAGRPGKAIDFLGDNQKLEKEKKLIKDLIKISHSHLAERFQYVRGLTDREENVKEILDSWLRYFRELLLKKMNYLAQGGEVSLRASSFGDSHPRPKGRGIPTAEIKITENSLFLPEEVLMFKKYSLLKLKNVLKVIQNITFQVARTNVNQKLALEILMLEL